MTNAYRYSDLVNNVTDKKAYNAEYCRINDLAQTPMRTTDILIQPSSSDFEPYQDGTKTHTVSLKYSTKLTLKYNGNTLAYTTSDSTRTSSIIVPEYQNGQPYYPILYYLPVSRVSIAQGTGENKTTTYSTSGMIELGRVNSDKEIKIYPAYKFDFDADDNVSYISYSSLNAPSGTTMNLPNSVSLSYDTVYVNIVCKEGYIVDTVTGTGCTITATTTKNRYKIVSTASEAANINIITKTNVVSTYTVKIIGLNHATATYNSTALGETDGTATIANIESGSELTILIKADSNYRISQIAYGSTTQTLNAIQTTITVPVEDADVTITCSTKLYYTLLSFAENEYLKITWSGKEHDLSDGGFTVTVPTTSTSSFTLTPKNSRTLKTVSVAAPSNVAKLTDNGNGSYTLTLSDVSQEKINITSTVDGQVIINYYNVEHITLQDGSTSIYTGGKQSYQETITYTGNIILIRYFDVEEGYKVTDIVCIADNTELLFIKSFDGWFQIEGTAENINIYFTVVEDTETFSTLSTSTETINIDGTNADTDTYNVYIFGANKAYALVDGNLLPTTARGTQLLYYVPNVESGSEIEITFRLARPTEYKFGGYPTSLGYTLNWNDSTNTLIVKDINSSADIFVYIDDITSETSADNAVFVPLGSQTDTYKKWNKIDIGYEHSVPTAAGEATSWICFEYHTDSKYIFNTDFRQFGQIVIYRSATLVELQDVDFTGKIVLNATDYMTDSGYEITPAFWSENTDYRYVYFSFVVLEAAEEKIKFNSIYESMRLYPSSLLDRGVYRSDDVVDFHLVVECDPTSQTIPYSQMSFRVYDEKNSFSLTDLSLTDDSNKYKQGTPYNVYMLSAEVKNTTDDILDTDYYTTQIARVFLDDISYANDYILFTFIGVIEKYDKIYLTQVEKRLSHFSTAANIKTYIQQLFGSDADVSGIPDGYTALTPFTDESKTEILRTLCEYLNLIMFEGTDGKIHFSTSITANNPIAPSGLSKPFALTLDNSSEFTAYEPKHNAYDGVSVQIIKRSGSTFKKLLDEYALEFYVKNDTWTDSDWQDDIGWNIYFRIQADKMTYFDVNGTEYGIDTDIDFGGTVANNILNTHGNIKYCKFLLAANNPLVSTQFRGGSMVSSNGLMGDYAYTPEKFIDFLQKSFFIRNPNYTAMENLFSYYYSERGLEIYFIFPIAKNANGYDVKFWVVNATSRNPFSDDINDNVFSEYLTGKAEEINFPEVVFIIWLELFAVMSNTTFSELETSEAVYAYKENKAGANILDIANPLVSDYTEAIMTGNLALITANALCMEANYNNWRGNGLIELADNILIENSSGRNVNSRKYGQYYCGKVAKMEYDFDGALSMATTLCLPRAALYSSDNSGDTVLQSLSSNIPFSTNKISFTEKTT